MVVRPLRLVTTSTSYRFRQRSRNCLYRFLACFPHISLGDHRLHVAHYLKRFALPCVIRQLFTAISLWHQARPLVLSECNSRVSLFIVFDHCLEDVSLICFGGFCSSVATILRHKWLLRSGSLEKTFPSCCCGSTCRGV